MMRNYGRRINAQGGDIIAAKAFSRKQAVFNEKAAQYANAGVITTPGFLRLESLCPTTATSSINFNTLDTSGTKTSTERRLKLSDTFTVTELSFYIGAGDATSNSPTATQYAKQSLHTFPNNNVAAFSTNTANLEVLYNSFLTLRVDTTTFLDSVPLRQFYRVGTSQQGVLGGGAGGVAVQADEWTQTMYGRTELLPTIELNGQSNIEWSITLPDSTILSNQSTKFVNCVLFCTGFLNQGGATVQRKIQRRLR
jgi:hypothetical protein